MFSDLVRRLIPQCPNVRYLICLDQYEQENKPQLEKVLDYETLISENEEVLWEDFSALRPDMLYVRYYKPCVLYSHRSTVLHSFAVYLIAQVFPRWIQCLRSSRCFMLMLGVTPTPLSWLVQN